MPFRNERGGDLEKLKAKSSKQYDKLDEPKRYDEAVTFVDDGLEPRLVMRAAKVAEVYLALDHEWGTPAMRWAMIEQGYREIQQRLKAKGYTTAYCFFPDGVPNGYIRRMVKELGAKRVMDRCVRFTAA